MGSLVGAVTSLGYKVRRRRLNSIELVFGEINQISEASYPVSMDLKVRSVMRIIG